jgi:hypothetical protein
VPTCSGSDDPEGLLTFKFDTSASGWDNGVYIGVIQRLLESLTLKDGKSILECVRLRRLTSQADTVIQRTGSKSSMGGRYACQ